VVHVASNCADCWVADRLSSWFSFVLQFFRAYKTWTWNFSDYWSGTWHFFKTSPSSETHTRTQHLMAIVKKTRVSQFPPWFSYTGFWSKKFLQARCPSCRPANSVKALKDDYSCLRIACCHHAVCVCVCVCAFVMCGIATATTVWNIMLTCVVYTTEILKWCIQALKSITNWYDIIWPFFELLCIFFAFCLSRLYPVWKLW